MSILSWFGDEGLKLGGIILTSGAFEGFGDWSLGEINAISIHVQSIQETSKTLTEPRQTLMHQLQINEILF